MLCCGWFVACGYCEQQQASSRFLHSYTQSWSELSIHLFFNLSVSDEAAFDYALQHLPHQDLLKVNEKRRKDPCSACNVHACCRLCVHPLLWSPCNYDRLGRSRLRRRWRTLSEFPDTASLVDLNEVLHEYLCMYSQEHVEKETLFCNFTPHFIFFELSYYYSYYYSFPYSY